MLLIVYKIRVKCIECFYLFSFNIVNWVDINLIIGGSKSETNSTHFCNFNQPERGQEVLFSTTQQHTTTKHYLDTPVLELSVIPLDLNQWIC